MQLVLPYLGSRDYLHGTTLFDALLPLAPCDAEFTFKFARMIRSNVVSVAGEAGDASLAWKSPSAGPGAFHVTPLAIAAPVERRAYPESLVASCVTVEGKRARYEGESPFSLVATLIPIHKTLLAENVTPTKPGQWVFTRLDLARRVAAFTAVELHLTAYVPDQLARSTITISGEEIGTLYFSWLNQTPR